ncbi:MAG TPA: hypothetical protein VNR40_17715 [Steroidobacter sp.]|nr:hypothetical protein [Steroidobacter sp.]
MMTFLYLFLAALGASAFYLATPHAPVTMAARVNRQYWRMVGGILSVSSLLVAMKLLGTWPGFFAALTASMLTMVTLPYLNGWWQMRRGHAG